MARVAVIGAGIAGLAAAARLAALGIEVDVYDKRLGQGGPVTSVTQGPYSYDVGPQWLTLPPVWDELFAACGEHRSSYFSMQALDTMFRVHIDAETHFDISRNIQATQDSLAEAGLETPDAFLSFMKQVTEHSSYFADRAPYQFPWHKPKKVVERTLVAMRRSTTSDYVAAALDTSFGSNAFSDSFKVLAGQFGLDPFRAPTSCLGLFRSLFEMGLWYPEGGMSAVVRALGLLCSRKGVRFVPGAIIDRIMVSGNKVTGVSVAKVIHDCDAVIATGSAAHDHSLLRVAGEPSTAKSSPAMANMVYLLGVKQQHSALAHNNVFLSDNVMQEYENLHQRRLPDSASSLVTISCKTNRRMAPGTCENWYVRTSAPWVEIEDDTWDLEKNRVLRRLLQRFNDYGISIDKQIETKTSLSPADFEHSFLQWKGSGWGLNHSHTRNSLYYSQPKHPRIEGLYNAGTFVPPGPGVAFSLLSASRAAVLCAKSFGVQTQLDKNRFHDFLDAYE